MSLTISIIQANLHWEDKEANLKMLEEKIWSLTGGAHIIVLPEMFSTGFSMRPEALGETMDGATVKWMRQLSAKTKKIITGSLIIEDEGKYFNRLIWMMPNGIHYHYDKRHLFAYAGEDRHYSSGTNKLIVQVNGWRICPLICYDLRFPVWSRQSRELYDILIYVANWPQRRSLAWKTLLQARAIENQCYAIGVNRVGDDGNNIYYSGDSSITDPVGNTIWQQPEKEAVFTYTFEKDKLAEVRNHFPFLNDADGFIIT